jgi:RNA polymerase sigma-70 factor (ECF subfamily)
VAPVSAADDLLTRVESAGRAAWPDVTFDRARLASALAELGDRVPPDEHLGDLALAIASSGNDAAALRHLDRILAQTAGAVRRYDASEAFLADVLQRVRIHLLVADGTTRPRIHLYDGRASLRVWLGVCAVRTALYVLRGARNAKEQAQGDEDWADTIAALPTGQAELEEVRAKYAEVFNRAWRAACAALPPRQRAVLKMCFVEDCPIDTIAATYAVHRVTVWRWLEDAKKRLLEGTRERLGAELSVGAPGTYSLLEMVRSQLDLGLSQIDRAPDRVA